MEKKSLSTAFVIIFVGFMVTLRVDGYPYKWPKFYSPSSETSSEAVQVIPSSSMSASSGKATGAGQGKDVDAVAKAAPQKSGEMKSSGEEESDDETERVLEEAFRTSPDINGDKKSPGSDQARPSGDANYRRYDYKPGIRPSSLIPHNPRDRIVFPDDIESTSPEKLLRLSGCSETTFCEDTPYYPTEVVERALRSNSNLKYLETIDELEPPVIGERISDDEETLCISKEQLVRPKLALNKDKEWRIIVNDNNFTQAIRVEICKTDNRPCEVIDGFADGYKTMCKQKYVYRQLVAVTNDNLVAPEMFQMPASCCCQIKWVASPLVRMGINITKNNNNLWTPKDDRKPK